MMTTQCTNKQTNKQINKRRAFPRALPQVEQRTLQAGQEEAQRKLEEMLRAKEVGFAMREAELAKQLALVEREKKDALNEARSQREAAMSLVENIKQSNQGGRQRSLSIFAMSAWQVSHGSAVGGGMYISCLPPPPPYINTVCTCHRPVLGCVMSPRADQLTPSRASTKTIYVVKWL